MQAGARLSLSTFRGAAAAALPAYDPADVSCGIVHLGVGAFHRAHQAVYVDDCLGAGETSWGIVGASLRSPDTRDALAPQDGLYALAVQEPGGEQLRVIGAIREMLVAPEDPAALVLRMADPTIRIVTLTLTEKAYLRDAAGGLDLAHPGIQHDLANPDAPLTVYGFLLAALMARRKAGMAPFTVLCCDNLPANGETVRRLMIAFAAAADPAAADFVATTVSFPSTMVDRIVPATTDQDRANISAMLGLADAWPVKTEPFMQWVVEDDFPLGRPQWERFGVTMVEDVRPYEDMKLRLLNGAHSTTAYLGLLMRHATVSQAFGDPGIRRIVAALWREAIPTLPAAAGLDPVAYTSALADRFSNPALVHRIAQIAHDGSQKLPQRILVSARAQIGAGREATHLALAVAAWIAACAERGDMPPDARFTDPIDAELAAIFSRKSGADDVVRGVFEAAGFDVVLGEGCEVFARLTAGHLGALQHRGAASVLEGDKA